MGSTHVKGPPGRFPGGPFRSFLPGNGSGTGYRQSPPFSDSFRMAVRRARRNPPQMKVRMPSIVIQVAVVMGKTWWGVCIALATREGRDRRPPGGRGVCPGTLPAEPGRWARAAHPTITGSTGKSLKTPADL